MHLHHRFVDMNRALGQQLASDSLPERTKIEVSHLNDPIGHGAALQRHTYAFPHLLLPVQGHGVHILLHQHIGDNGSRGVAVCQQGRWHDRLEYLGIPGLLFKLAVGINLPVMLDNLRLGAFQNELCTDIFLPDVDQRLSVGIRLFFIRQIHDSLFYRQRRTKLFQRALFLPAMTGDADFLLRILRKFWVGLLLRFLRRVEQAELLIPVVKNV